MILTIHRGSDQIGGSCVELRSNRGARILLDAGMPLTRPDGSDWPRGTMSRPSEELRREGVLPDISGLYAGSSPEVSALVLSHAHLDHYGLAHYVHPRVPVYGSRGTIEMLQASKLFIPDVAVPADLRKLPAAGTITIASFSVRGIPVDHAAPDSRALLVEADGQRLLYSGDLRAHGRQRRLFDELPGSAGRIDVLVLEGTTVGQPRGSHGFAEETDVELRLSELLKRDGGMVFVIASGQNIDRAVSVYLAALAAGRELVIDSYQAYILMTVKRLYPDAPQYDSPSVRVKFFQGHVEKLREARLWGLACKMSRAAKVTTAQLAADPKRFVYLARSSGATVNLLRNLARTSCPTIVWSMWRDYLKKGGPVPSYCASLGIKTPVIHSGGHASPEDLAALASRIHPSAVVPIHTEAALQFEAIMPNVRVVTDGKEVDVTSLIGDGDRKPT